jgi:hypothetical protein
LFEDEKRVKMMKWKLREDFRRIREKEFGIFSYWKI